MRNFFQLGFQYLPLDVVCSVVEELAKKLMTSYLCLQVVKKEACMYTWLRAVVRYLLVLLHSLVETPHPLAHTKTTLFGLEWMQNIFFLLSSDREEVENDSETNTESGCQGQKHTSLGGTVNSKKYSFWGRFSTDFTTTQTDQEFLSDFNFELHNGLNVGGCEKHS